MWDAREYKTLPILIHKHELARRHEAPMVHSVRTIFPDFRSLREVFVPGTRLKVTQVFVEHHIQLGEQFDDLLVGIVVIGKDVVASSMATWSPEQRDTLPGKVVARLLYMRPVF